MIATGKGVIVLMILVLVSGVAQAQAQKNKKEKKKDDYPMRVNVWTLGKDLSPVDYKLDEDTTLHLFQVYDKNEKQSISTTNLGNMASPYISNVFDDRPINKWNSIIFFNSLNDFGTFQKRRNIIK